MKIYVNIFCFISINSTTAVYLSAHLWLDLLSEQKLKVLGVILMGGKAVC